MAFHLLTKFISLLFFAAVKCNDSPIVIQTLAELGVGFDCASRDEISKVMSHGVASHSIIYANPTKPISHLKFADEMRITTMTVDCDFELHKIHKHYPRAKFVTQLNLIQCREISLKLVDFDCC